MPIELRLFIFETLTEIATYTLYLSLIEAVEGKDEGI